MLGDTLTITVNAVDKVLKKINQDSYSAEYLLRETTQSFTAKVRHASEKSLLDGKKVDRHNVEITQRVFPTEGNPLGTTRQAYTVIRNQVDDAAASVEYLSDALGTYVNANGAALVGWES